MFVPRHTEKTLKNIWFFKVFENVAFWALWSSWWPAWAHLAPFLGRSGPKMGPKSNLSPLQNVLSGRPVQTQIFLVPTRNCFSGSPGSFCYQKCQNCKQSRAPGSFCHWKWEKCQQFRAPGPFQAFFEKQEYQKLWEYHRIRSFWALKVAKIPTVSCSGSFVRCQNLKFARVS